MCRKILVGLLAVVLAGPTAAEFSGKGELGVVIARGNSDSETANGRVQLVYERERWTNESNFSVVHARDSGETTTSRYVASNKTDYSLGERSYVLAAARYDRDRFSSFSYQASLALGYGRKLIDTGRHELKGEIGPGFKYSKMRDTGETNSEAIVRGFLEYGWEISDTANLGNRLLVEAAEDNTFAENELSLTVAINSRLSLKAGLAVRHNTDVEPEREKTDTLTTLNLVYNFGK